MSVYYRYKSSFARIFFGLYRAISYLNLCFVLYYAACMAETGHALRVWKSEGKGPLERLGRKMRIVLRRTDRKEMGWMWNMDCFDLAQDRKW
jgi:hypothetical protein